MAARKANRPNAASFETVEFSDIRAFAATLQGLHRQKAAALAPSVERLIRARSRNIGEIKHTLDQLLDCACIPNGLSLFRSLCRYYFSINPAATADYVYAYREMWDNEESEQEEE